MSVSANEVFQLIKPYPLSSEKVFAIESAPVASPTLVVAGAGSGKTELLTVRVLYLVANGFARPEQILGLTFTKKAAAELSKRIFSALIKLRASDYWPSALEHDFSPPLIATYNSFANQIFRENALALGYESEAKLLSDAAAFQLAREVCLKYGSAVSGSLSELDFSLETIVEKVVELAQALNDHQSSAQQIRDVVEQTGDLIAGLAASNRGGAKRYGYIDEMLGGIAPTPLLAELAQRYQQEKQLRSVVDYSDQVALAHRAVIQFPDVAKELSERFTQVLLDEYQDTSVLQTRLLSGLFAKRAVFAVGDPNQSIYGWRGASATNLDDFAREFGSAKLFSLATSWRNPLSVLELANSVAKPLATPASFVSASENRIAPVTLSPMDQAQEGEIVVNFSQTLDQEIAELANWLAPKVDSGQSCAVLMRKRANMAQLVDGLQNAGLEVEVVGLGGLLELPEIVDLVAALKVVQRTDSGAELIRLLSGARWRIGLKDIDRLNSLANILSAPPEKGQPRQSLTLTEALDALPQTSSKLLQEFSETALARLRQAAELFRKLRSAVALPLADFVRVVAEELWLDIELLANPRLKNPLGQLSAFFEIVANFSSLSAAAELAALLNWLDYAKKKERFETPKVSSGRVVQVLTVHAAKGLEWDCVAIVNLVEDDFPAKPKSSSGWLTGSEFPYPLRGDAASLPSFELGSARLQIDAKNARDKFRNDNREHQLREEYRLMYVAITRSMKSLYLSGCYWKPGNLGPRKPSRFLTELFPSQQFPDLESQLNPLDENPKTAKWPPEPLGAEHRVRLEKLAAEVIAAMPISQDTSFQQQIDILLREQDERLEKLNRVSLPVRIAASKFADFVNDPVAQAERYLRPMPQQPYRATLTGTMFHSWVEDFLVQRIDSEVPDIEKLKEVFKNSRFDPENLLHAELEINLTHRANSFICKLDAVFQKGDRVEIVDWKTGEPPQSEEDNWRLNVQLALYRYAYSKLFEFPIEQIDICFYFVSENRELVPQQVPDFEELMGLWEKLFS